VYFDYLLFYFILMVISGHTFSYSLQCSVPGKTNFFDTIGFTFFMVALMIRLFHAMVAGHISNHLFFIFSDVVAGYE